MNVFVLCTGRCGSLTFTRACSHIENFTALHESRVATLGDERVAYPPDHIEVDNRLAWFLGRLDRAYGDDAYYVHLTREPASTAASWARRYGVLGGMATGFRDYILSDASRTESFGRHDAAVDLVRTVTENIELFLKDKTHVLRLRMENAEEEFPRFWTWIGARGDLSAAMDEWRLRHDTEDQRLRLKQRLRDFVQKGVRAYFPPP